MRADGALSSNRVDGIFNQLRGGGGGGGERGRGRGELAERDEGAVLDPFQALPAHVERRRRGQLLGRVVQEGAPRDLQQVGHGCCGEVVSCFFSNYIERKLPILELFGTLTLMGS